VPAAVRARLVTSLRNSQVDLAARRPRPGIVGGPEPAAAYLALPPRVFPAAVTALGAAGLAPGSRIVVEKPFGEDFQSARARNRLLAEVTDEQGCSGSARQLAVVGDRALWRWSCGFRPGISGRPPAGAWCG
jgi:glucose-6-phosphate 1-dehydrogenase